jgi:glycosyltransferase involved in cell wall biosynthesis
VPNGVNLDAFCPDPSLPKDNETLILSGKMSYHANVAMAVYMINEIMPLIWSQRPGVKVWIVGKNPSREVQVLAKNPLVTVTGTVSDISNYLKKATIAVAPLMYGAGIQNKVLEAMACGTPVVTNENTLKSLAAVPGENVFLANTPQEFARQVIYLLGNDNVRTKIGQAGRQYVEAQHNWEEIAARLGQIYKTLIV